MVMAAFCETRSTEEGNVTYGIIQKWRQVCNVGFGVKTKISRKHNLIFNERLMTLRIPPDNVTSLSLTHFYASIILSDDAMKETFYYILYAIIRTTPLSNKFGTLWNLYVGFGCHRCIQKGSFGREVIGNSCTDIFFSVSVRNKTDCDEHLVSTQRAQINITAAKIQAHWIISSFDPAPQTMSTSSEYIYRRKSNISPMKDFQL